MTRALAVLAALASIATACAPASRAPASGDPRVGTYVSSAWGFRTSSYWIEGPDGVVLIDTQFLPSAAEELLATAERETGKRVVLAIVLHANPDKFNGATVLARRGIRVVTSDAVRALVPHVFELRTRAFGARYAPDWPTEAPALESFGAESTTIDAAGLRLRAHVMGGGVSEAHVVIEWEGHVFVGDLVANGHHGWLELGLTSEWLARLDEIEALAPHRVHPGRGPSGGPELLGAQRAYLERVAAIVAASGPTWPAPPGAIERLQAEIEAAYPDLGHAVFLRIGLPAEVRRQALTRSDPSP